MKVPDVVLTNLSGSLKLDPLGLLSILEVSMEFFRFKSALNSLSFICSVMLFSFVDDLRTVNFELYDEAILDSISPSGNFRAKLHEKRTRMQQTLP